MARFAEVDAYLVLPACLELHLDKRRAAPDGKPAPFRPRKFPIRRIHNAVHFHSAFVVAEIRLEYAALLGKLAFDARDIGLLGKGVPVRTEVVGDCLRLREHEESASLAVEPMDEPDMEAAAALAFANVVVEPLLGGIRLLGASMGSQKPRGLVDDDQVAVFVEYLEWQSGFHSRGDGGRRRAFSFAHKRKGRRIPRARSASREAVARGVRP